MLLHTRTRSLDTGTVPGLKDLQIEMSGRNMSLRICWATIRWVHQSQRVPFIGSCAVAVPWKSLHDDLLPLKLPILLDSSVGPHSFSIFFQLALGQTVVSEVEIQTCWDDFFVKVLNIKTLCLFSHVVLSTTWPRDCSTFSWFHDPRLHGAFLRGVLATAGASHGAKKLGSAMWAKAAMGLGSRSVVVLKRSCILCVG